MIPIKPASATWTDEQWQAIYQSGNNIIVSAGAGSGKTAVLTERIIEKLKQGISIQNLIVLTFTNAAAFEMKVRVRKKINAEIKKGNESLKEQLSLLDQATITTFDSYSLSLVKKYHYLLNIPKDIKVIDNVLVSAYKKQLIEEIINEKFQTQDKNFLTLMDTFTVKDDKKMQGILLTINDKLDTLVDKKAFLETYIETFYQNERIEKQIENYVNLINKYQRKMQKILNKMLETVRNDKLYVFTKQLEENLQGILKSESYDDYVYFLRIYPSITFPRNKDIDEIEKEDIKERYEELKKCIEKIKELCCYQDQEEMKKSILSTKIYAKAIVDILKILNKRLWEYKKQENAYEFADITRLGLDLLEGHPDITEQIKNNINEIMIDEYQDTNDIGDYFISLIANHNIYMVGDIKQSIYRFRNANPKIFMDKYSNYSKHINGEKIDLNKNFRSRKEVLDDINELFQYIMDETIGGADYRNGHQMIFGNMSYEKNKPDQDYNLEILDYPYKDNEDVKEYRGEEVEAFIIGYDIINKIKNKHQIYDKDSNILRPIQYSDCAILLDRKNSFDLYKKIFTYLEIPLTIHKNEDFVASSEIYVIRSILKLIHSLKDSKYANQNFKHAYLSLKRSFLYQQSDDELLTSLATQKQNNQKVITILESDQELKQKIEHLSNYSENHSMKELLYEIYDQFNIYDQLTKIGDVDFIGTKLEYLLTVSENFNKIEEFINYFDSSIKEKIDVAFSLNKNTDNNTVNIMTIHASKGLEYYICYYAGLNKEFSKEDLKSKFFFDHELGIVLPNYQEGIKETFYKELVKDHYLEEEIAERIRVFYVALTRAKEKMIMVANLSDSKNKSKLDGNEIVDDFKRLEYNSFYDILTSINEVLTIYTKKVAIPPLSKDYEIIKEKNSEENKKENNSPKQIITISIQKEEMEQANFSSANTNEIVEQDTLEYGIKFHQILEYVDFSNLDNIEEPWKSKIEQLLNQEFMKNIHNSKIYREYEFIDQTDKEEKHGIIDLMIEEEDKIIIVDYKLKNIDKTSYKDQVKGYISYIKKQTTKEVTGYIYSLHDGIYLKVE